MVEEANTPYVEFDVVGRLATFGTAHEAAWQTAVRAAIDKLRVAPRPDGHFSVQMEFRTPDPTTGNHRWDLDNLVKPTLDAMEGIFGVREWRGVPETSDDLVIHLEASKRTISAVELAGAHVAVWLVR